MALCGGLWELERKPGFECKVSFPVGFIPVDSQEMKANTPSPKRFQWRATVSVVIMFSFLMLAASGTVLFIAPPGRVANWTDWAILGYTKSQWAAFHICFSSLFLAGTALHLFFNWRPLVSYFKNRVSRRVGFRREWIVGLAACAAVFAGTQVSVAPFSSLLALNEDLKQSWDRPEVRAPIPHAELLSIGELADQAGVEYSIAKERLAAQGISGLNENQLVRDIASEAGISAKRVYELICTDHSTRGPSGSNGRAWGGAGGHRLDSGAVGGGIGRKTVSEVCATEGVDIDGALRRLRDAGIAAEPDSTMRDVAEASGVLRPYEVLQLVRSEP